jgi:hypothetical protein
VVGEVVERLFRAAEDLYAVADDRHGRLLGAASLRLLSIT